jgi:hypothetical protein
MGLDLESADPLPVVFQADGQASAAPSRPDPGLGALHLYKKTMVPLLLVVAALLLLAGGVAIAVAVRGAADAAGAGLARRARLVACFAFPTACVLAGGAWLFRRDVRRAESRLRNRPAGRRQGGPAGG